MKNREVVLHERCNSRRKLIRVLGENLNQQNSSPLVFYVKLMRKASRSSVNVEMIEEQKLLVTALLCECGSKNCQDRSPADCWSDGGGLRCILKLVSLAPTGNAASSCKELDMGERT